MLVAHQWGISESPPQTQEGTPRWNSVLGRHDFPNRTDETPSGWGGRSTVATWTSSHHDAGFSKK